MVARLQHLSPSIWVFRHDGMNMEFNSLEAAIAYVRGFKSVSDSSKLRSLYGERLIINPAQLSETANCCVELHAN
jgi:hypothetical protein